MQNQNKLNLIHLYRIVYVSGLIMFFIVWLWKPTAFFSVGSIIALSTIFAGLALLVWDGWKRGQLNFNNHRLMIIAFVLLVIIAVVFRGNEYL